MCKRLRVLHEGLGDAKSSEARVEAGKAEAGERDAGPVWHEDVHACKLRQFGGMRTHAPTGNAVPLFQAVAKRGWLKANSARHVCVCE